RRPTALPLRRDGARNARPMRLDEAARANRRRSDRRCRPGRRSSSCLPPTGVALLVRVRVLAAKTRPCCPKRTRVVRKAPGQPSASLYPIRSLEKGEHCVLSVAEFLHLPRDLRVLISAGAGGLGASMARAFHDSGARVYVCDIDRVAVDR